MEMSVKKTNDFEISGKGEASVWKQTEWRTLTRVGKGVSSYKSSVKVLYSDTGIYFLFGCEDNRLTCTKQRDFDDIYLEDVVEVFLWPDESQNIYFEYEISPLGVELPLLIPNNKGVFMGWMPWHYEGDRKIRAATFVLGGNKVPMAEVKEWIAEFFIPFSLLKGLSNTPPVPGTKWRANMYRIDYDEKPATEWAWCDKTGERFHNFREFGTVVFGE